MSVSYQIINLLQGENVGQIVVGLFGRINVKVIGQVIFPSKQPCDSVSGELLERCPQSFQTAIT